MIESFGENVAQSNGWLLSETDVLRAHVPNPASAVVRVQLRDLSCKGPRDLVRAMHFSK